MIEQVSCNRPRSATTLGFYLRHRLGQRGFVSTHQYNISTGLRQCQRHAPADTGTAPGAQRDPSAQIEQLADLIQHLVILQPVMIAGISAAHPG